MRTFFDDSENRIIRWSTSNILQKMQLKKVHSSEAKDIYLMDFDYERLIGIGIDGANRYVLILPGQEDTLAFSTKSTEYEPLTSILSVNSGHIINGVSVLKCFPKNESNNIERIIASIMSAVIDIELTMGGSGRTIWQLKTLFENDFVANIEKSKLAGLIGELIVIHDSEDPNFLVDCWHSDVEGRFDFSYNNNRLEVKSNLDLSRKHYFRNSQVSSEFSSEILYASINVVFTDQGLSVSKLIGELFDLLNAQRAAKLKNLVLQTLKVPWLILDNYFIDFLQTSKSVLFFPSETIPRPSWGVDIDRIEWRASLDTSKAIHVLPHHFLCSSENIRD